MRQANLVIVANALPVRLVRERGSHRWQSSPGGLASALTPIAREEGGAWIGWTGEVDHPRRPFEHEGIWLVPMRYSAADAEDAYAGACNRMFWPLYHGAVRRPEYHRHWWRQYVAVNERYAKETAQIAAPGATVWVQDYHLQLVPSMLRQLRPDVRIGFFLHIPFPPEDLFIRLPWRRSILEGILGADVVGFQTANDARNFTRLVARLTPGVRSPYRVQLHGRSIRVKAYPISVDAERFDKTARDPAVLARAKAIADRLGHGRTIFLGVDRLDYTKGIDLRLKAFLQLLRSRPKSLEDAVFVQVAVPSRERIPGYQELRRNVEELVGQINGRFAEVGNALVHYVRRNLPFEELVAMYRAADVMVVTPLCDGMNLVSKEYVATRFDDTGVLILSEFAGAAAELDTALLVNPYDVDGVAEMMTRALEMPKREAAERMQAMRRTVRRRTVYRWAASFLKDLRDTESKAGRRLFR